MRPDSVREDRKQLVGLLPRDTDQIPPEGGQVVSQLEEAPPMSMIGHVTSSYYSATLGHSFCLALIKNGRKKMGETVHIPLLDQNIACEVTSPIFYDRAGKRQND